MNNTNQKLKEVFDLYSAGNFEKAKKINSEILKSEPKNIYAKKYETLLNKNNSGNLPQKELKKEKIYGIEKDNFGNKKAENLSEKKEKHFKVKGKTLKCPHCVSKIPFSGISENNQKLIKKGEYNNLELKCPYCHTNFVLQKRKSNSEFGLKIGDSATLDGKKYRITGSVKYKGKWFEGNYNGKTEYLEWVLLGEDNSYYYFSEGKSYDDGEVEYEYEFSKKIIPNFTIPENFNEKVEVEVISVYGENSKIYTVGEKVQLGEFSNGGKKYVVEKEGVGAQKEAGIYEVKNISFERVCSVFNKNIYNKNTSNVPEILVSGFETKIIFGISALFSFIFSVHFIVSITICFIGYYLFVVYGKKIKFDTKNIFIGGVLLFPVFTFFIFQPLFNSILESKTEIKLNNIEQSQKIELFFNQKNIEISKKINSKRYDYGGIRTYFKQNIGLKFSVKSEEDFKIIKKINDNFLEKNINKKFKTGKLYKLK